MTKNGACMRLWKQLIMSIVVVAIAFAGWVWMYPGAGELLGRYGIDWLPVSSTADAPQAGGQRGQGGPGGGGRFGGGSRETLVVTAEAATGVVNDRLSAIGTGQAVRTVTVRPLDQGQIAAIPVSSGAEVQAGETILTLNSAEQELAVERARLAVDDAENKAERFRNLAARKAVSSVEAETADSELRTARVALREAELALDKRTVKAPISGVLGILAVNPGDYVTTQTDITNIDDRSRVRVEFFVPERFAALMQHGASVEATATAFPGELFEGTIAAVDNRIDETSRTLRVQADIPNEDGRLRAGMSFRVVMRFAGETYPSIDPLAIQWDSKGPYVWRVADGKAGRIDIAIVQRNADRVLVKAPIAEGDAIVTEGVQSVREGAAVRVANAPVGQENASGDGAPQSGRRQGS